MNEFSRKNIQSIRRQASGIFQLLARSLPGHIFHVSLIVATIYLLSASFAEATLTYSGNVSPSNPSGWGSTTTAYIGNSSDGTIVVDGGNSMLTKISYFGNPRSNG